MREFEYKIELFETDMYENVPPSRMVQYYIDATKLMGIADGIDNTVMLEKLGAVWMVARLKTEQWKHVRAGDRLKFQVEELGTDLGTYIRYVDALVDGERIGKCGLVYMVVSHAQRRILRPAAVSELWGISGKRPYPVKAMPKLRPTQEFFELRRMDVRYSDCDLNGHFSSSKYVDFICEAADYWKRGQSIMTSLQIDFNTEFKPEETVTMTVAAGGDGDALVLRGLHADGRVGFTTKCKISKA